MQNKIWCTDTNKEVSFFSVLGIGQYCVYKCGYQKYVLDMYSITDSGDIKISVFLVVCCLHVFLCTYLNIYTECFAFSIHYWKDGHGSCIAITSPDGGDLKQWLEALNPLDPPQEGMGPIMCWSYICWFLLILHLCPPLL